LDLILRTFLLAFPALGSAAGDGLETKKEMKKYRQVKKEMKRKSTTTR